MSANANWWAGKLRLLPDENICQRDAVDPGSGLCKCLVVSPVECPHSLSLGHTYFCKQPIASRQIRSRTERSQNETRNI
jgi:hypothetical protein